MEFEEETENDKTYTTMDNVYNNYENYQELQFEKFLITENSDCEDEQIENFNYPDYSNTDGVDIIDTISNDSSFISENSTPGYEEWKSAVGSRCLDLNDLMKMNRNEKFMLLQLFKKIKGFLNHVQSKIKSLGRVSDDDRAKESTMYLGHVGAPYFKTKKEKFCSNPNSDTLDRRKKGILSIHHICFSSKWSTSECENLTRGIILNYNLNKQRALLKKISSSKQKLVDQTNPEIITQIEKTEGELRNLRANGAKDLPPLSENKFIDWDYISTEYLHDKHNAQECASFWRIYLHPHINKSNWSSEENKNIIKLAKKYNEQCWDQIAEELGTNRSAFTVFIHYSSSLNKCSFKERFTKEEDQLLLQHIESKKIGSFIPWATIAEYFPNRDKAQIMRRYKYYLMYNSQYTNKFSDAEDILILLLVERFGRNYILFPKYLPSKSYMQIKLRYDNHLRYERVKGGFTLEEDKQIMNQFSNSSPEVSLLASQLTRNRNQMRQRYKQLTAFLQKHPDKSLENIQRRCTQNKDTFRRLAFLKCIVDQFKDEPDIPTLSDIENKLGKKKKLKKNNDLDNLLVEFFSTSYKIKQKYSSTYIYNIKNAAEQIDSILKFFRIDLQIPADLVKNNTFDVIDLEILNLLREKNCADVPKSNLHEIFPPNINSLLGLRGLLMKNQVYKKCRGKKKLALETPVASTSKEIILSSEIDNILSDRSENIQNDILEERHLFLNRFISMFMWPALLSIKPPNTELLNKELVLCHRKTPVINNVKGEHEKKVAKRKAEKKPLILPPNKKQKTIKKVEYKGKFEHDETVQPIRSSSRLKEKRVIEEKIEKDNQAIKPLKIKNEQLALEQTSSIESPSKDSQTNLNGTTKINEKKCSSNSCETFSKTSIIPSNLVRVDKSEIIKLLKQKKPINIIRIQCNNKQDMLTGQIPSTMDRIDKINTAEKSNILETSILHISDIGKVNQVSNNSNSFLENNPLNLDKMRKSLSESLRKNGDKSPHEASDKKSKFDSNDANDLNKLNSFLNSIHENGESAVDLSEDQVMKNEVNQLDQLINQEGSFKL